MGFRLQIPLSSVGFHHRYFWGSIFSSTIRSLPSTPLRILNCFQKNSLRYNQITRPIGVFSHSPTQNNLIWLLVGHDSIFRQYILRLWWRCICVMRRSCRIVLLSVLWIPISSTITTYTKFPVGPPCSPMTTSSICITSPFFVFGVIDNHQIFVRHQLHGITTYQTCILGYRTSLRSEVTSTSNSISSRVALSLIGILI